MTALQPVLTLGAVIGLPNRSGRHVRMSYAPTRRCATPDCGMVLTSHNRAGLFGRFCRPHADQLAAIRTELEATVPDKREYRIWGTRFMLEGKDAADAA